MTGPIDESRHGVLYIGEDGVQVYVPKPFRELTPEEELRVRDLQAIERWMDRLYERRRNERST
jgi:hypothetical protein